MWRQALGRLLWGLAAHSLALLPGWMEGGGPTAPTRWPVWRWPPGARPTLLGSGFHGSAHTWTPSGGGLRGVHAGNSGCGDPRAPRLEVASGGCAPKGSLATHAPCLEAASGGASAIIIVLNFMPELVAALGPDMLRTLPVWRWPPGDADYSDPTRPVWRWPPGGTSATSLRQGSPPGGGLRGIRAAYILVPSFMPICRSERLSPSASASSLSSFYSSSSLSFAFFASSLSSSSLVLSCSSFSAGWGPRRP